jgi:hypothetical protein
VNSITDPIPEFFQGVEGKRSSLSTNIGSYQEDISLELSRAHSGESVPGSKANTDGLRRD